MYHFQDKIEDTKGNALTGFYVRAMTSAGETVPIYADAALTPIISDSGVADMAKVDADGMADFFVAVGTYDLGVYGTDATTLIRRFTSVPMNVDADTAASAEAAAARAEAAAASVETAAEAVDQAIAILESIADEPTSGTSLTAASRVALALLATDRPAILHEAGREGIFVFNSTNLSAKVTADTLQGLYVPPSTDTTGASGAWVRQFTGPADFRWFGAVADCSAVGLGTTNTATFDAAVTALVAAGRRALHIPQQSAAYRFATAPAQIHDQIMISGDGWSYNPGTVGATSYTGVAAYNGTVLCFDEDVAGFKFVAFTDNLANATAYEFQSAIGSCVRDIMLYSAGGTGITAHGIERRTIVHLDNVRIEGFAGHGLKTSAWTSGANPYGIVLAYARMVSARYNKLSGIFTEGDDSNVLHYDMCDSALNGGVGFLEKGLLGNVYTSCHAATNNASYGTPAGYSAAQRTQNTTDWSGLSDTNAGSYVTTSAVGCHVFTGCYVEVGVGAKHEIIYPSLISGGNLASTSGTATAIANPCRIDNAASLTGVDSITTRLAGLSVTDTIISDPASGNAVLKAKGSGSYAYLKLFPSDSSTNGLEIIAGLGGAYHSANDHQFRDAATTTTYATIGATGALVKSGQLGYGTGVGGTVTQATSKSTGVTLSKASGQITMNNAALAAAAKVSFVVTNTTVAATDTIIVNVASGGTANAYRAAVTAVAAGSFTITVENITAGSLSQAPIINFAVIKAVAA